jgi:hypothetical protein
VAQRGRAQSPVRLLFRQSLNKESGKSIDIRKQRCVVYTGKVQELHSGWKEVARNNDTSDTRWERAVQWCSKAAMKSECSSLRPDPFVTGITPCRHYFVRECSIVLSQMVRKVLFVSDGIIRIEIADEFSGVQARCDVQLARIENPDRGTLSCKFYVLPRCAG